MPMPATRREDCMVVIPTYNEREMLPSCVEAVVRAMCFGVGESKEAVGLAKRRIVVSDGGSKDGTVALAREMGVKVVEVGMFSLFTCCALFCGCYCCVWMSS